MEDTHLEKENEKNTNPNLEWYKMSNITRESCAA